MGHILVTKAGSCIIIIFTIMSIMTGVSAQQTDIHDFQSELVNYVVWSPDGSKIGVASTDGFLSIWQTADLRHTVTFDAFTEASAPSGPQRYDFAWSPDGARIVTGGHDTFLRVWNVADGKLLATLMQENAFVTDVDWSDNGAFIGGTQAGDFGVEIWDATTYQRVSAYPNSSVSIDFSPDSRQFVMGVSGIIGIYDTRSGELLYGLPAPAENQTFYLFHLDELLGTVIWTPDHRYIIGFRSNNSIEVWDIESKQMKHSFENPGLPFFSPVTMDFDTVSNNTFSLVGLDGILQTRDLESGKLIEQRQVIEAGQPSAFSPYGGRLAVIDAQVKRANGELPLQIIVPIASVERVQGIAQRCVADANNLTSAVTDVFNRTAIESLTETTLPAFVEAVEALPSDAIPPACRADLIAVAEAVIDEP